MQMELSFTKKDKENDPATCLYLLIRAQQDAMKGLRSRREIQQILDKSIEVQYANPAHKYKVVDKLGKGG